MPGQAVNPFLPSYEYVPDGEPHIFDDRLYLFGSHDRFNGLSFCQNDYVCWSAPLTDLSAWRYEGVIFRKSQDPHGHKGLLNALYAPDVCRGPDGRFYLFYFIGYTGVISVAVSDEPAGHYERLGSVRYRDGMILGRQNEPLQFDPGVFVDDDGQTYLYTGFGPVGYPLMGGRRATEQGAMCCELEPDMLTIKSGPSYIGVPAKPRAAGTGFAGHEFFEASSMRKFDGRYYFIYSSYLGHELCYATSDSPQGPFRLGGTLVSIGDVGLRGIASPSHAANFTGNTHGSIVKIDDDYFVFYHRQTNRHQFSRQACAEQLTMREDGGFDQAEITSCGLNRQPLAGKGTYEASIACHLSGRRGTRFYGVVKPPKDHEPFFTQTGRDREDKPDQFVANVCDGTVIGYKYFDFDDTKAISVRLRGDAKGVLQVSTAEEGQLVGVIPVNATKQYRDYFATTTRLSGKAALYFTFHGHGHFDFLSFTLS